MRLFIALTLSDEVRLELAALQARIASPLLRQAAPAGLHLTLQFLGETNEASVPQLLDALTMLPAMPLRLQLAGVGAFPDLRKPRVVWAGVGGQLAELAQLQAAVVAATAPLGFAPDERPYRPHLTLGRVRQDGRPDLLRALGETIGQARPPAPLAWEPGGPLLFKSVSGPGGAVYTALGPKP
jgi:2'-5' RNA ligase